MGQKTVARPVAICLFQSSWDMSATNPDFKALFESAPGLYLVLDPDLMIVAVSEAYLNATMTKRAEILGRGLFEVFPDNPDDPEATGVTNLRTSLDRVRHELVADTMAVQKYDIRRPESEGGGYEIRYWSPLNSPVLAPNRSLTHIIHRVEDVTEFVRLREQGVMQQQLTEDLRQRATKMEIELFERSQELQKLNGQLLAASKAKSVFLANMSHELRTPLSAILGFSELLLDDDGRRFNGAARKGFLEHIHTGGQHLLSLINDILDLSKVEAGQMKLRLKTVSVAKLIDDVVSTAEPLAAKKQLKVETNTSSAGELLADAGKLTQMLLNLVSNAIKFTPEGGIITIGARRTPQMLEISVADTGIGISQADRGRIFHEFQQLDSGLDRQVQGTGLGLALTRRYAALHGGDVRVESEVGRGSVFTLSLPLAGPVLKKEQDADPVRSTTDDPAFADRPLILVVEDDPVAAELVTHIVERGGFRTEIARTGTEALAKARELHPVAITLDIVLPDLDGWDVLERLKHDETTSAIPVAVVSVVDNPELGAALGALDYFVKPVRAAALLKRLSLFNFQRAIGRDEVRVLVVDDEEANRELLAGVLEPAGFKVSLAAGGLEGIQLARSGHPDLILLDLLMPDVNGFDVVKVLRAEESTHATPIMVLTAKEMTQTDKRQLNGHVSAVLSRDSTGTSDLLGQLRHLLASYAVDK
jgi:signal transduction histidine kinase/CheY-like chemotaxis protein